MITRRHYQFVWSEFQFNLITSRITHNEEGITSLAVLFNYNLNLHILREKHLLKKKLIKHFYPLSNMSIFVTSFYYNLVSEPK